MYPYVHVVSPFSWSWYRQVKVDKYRSTTPQKKVRPLHDRRQSRPTYGRPLFGCSSIVAQHKTPCDRTIAGVSLMRSSYCGRPTAEKSTCNITYDRDACDSATMASHNRSTSAAMYGRLRVCPTHGHFTTTNTKLIIYLHIEGTILWLAYVSYLLFLIPRSQQEVPNRSIAIIDNSLDAVLRAT